MLLRILLMTFVIPLSGLMSDLERKNVESIAYRHEQDRRNLYHFMGCAEWDHKLADGVGAGSRAAQQHCRQQNSPTQAKRRSEVLSPQSP